MAGEMMTRTVTHGTSKKAFWDSRGRPLLPGIRVAAKTGTLSRYEPHRTYNWWVGYAPVDDPRIAVAALVVNDPKWRIKPSYLALEALREYLIR
jgi:cell division protein FtsI/penicillin-binding protein 2